MTHEPQVISLELRLHPPHVRENLRAHMRSVAKATWYDTKYTYNVEFGYINWYVDEMIAK